MTLKLAISTKKTQLPSKGELKGRSRALSQSIHRALEAHYGRPERYIDLPETSCLKTYKVKALLQFLVLPISTPMLTTNIARLPKPLVRGQLTQRPKDLCHVHTWLEPEYIVRFADLIAAELWSRSAGLYKYPKEGLTQETREMLYPCLLMYKEKFTPKPSDKRPVEIIKSPQDAFCSKRKRDDRCVACDIGALLQDIDAFKALATLCKGRKRRRYRWPELLAFLEPIESGTDDGWRRRWLKEGKYVRKDRRHVRNWLKDGGNNGLESDAHWNPDEGEEVPIVYSPDFEAVELHHSGQTPRAGRPPTGTSTAPSRPRISTPSDAPSGIGMRHATARSTECLSDEGDEGDDLEDMDDDAEILSYYGSDLPSSATAHEYENEIRGARERAFSTASRTTRGGGNRNG